ncbi:hypothetical protein ABK040_003160 [Willaertia magna]
MTKQLQDISFILFDYCYSDSNTSSNTVYDISQLNSFLIHKLRNKRTTKKQYSENFNLIDVLKHESIRCPYDVKTNQKFIFIASVRVKELSKLLRLYNNNSNIIKYNNIFKYNNNKYKNYNNNLFNNIIEQLKEYL